jgi:hypothetical protein
MAAFIEQLRVMIDHIVDGGDNQHHPRDDDAENNGADADEW